VSNNQNKTLSQAKNPSKMFFAKHLILAANNFASFKKIRNYVAALNFWHLARCSALFKDV